MDYVWPDHSVYYVAELWWQVEKTQARAIERALQ